MDNHLKRLIPAAAVVLGLLLVSGCGVDQSPVASGPGGEEIALAPGDGDLAPAAKKVNAEKAAAREAKIAARKAEIAAKKAAREQAKAEKAAARAAAKAEKAAAREQAKAERQAARQANRGLALEGGISARETETKTIGPKGGKLMVGYLFGDSEGDDLIAQLRIRKGALDEDTDITMSLYEEEGQLVLAFQPGGLVFNPDAILSLKVGEDHVGVLESLVALHMYADPDTPTEMARIKRIVFVDDDEDDDDEDDDDYYKIMLKIPGFSRYSLGGDDWTWINGF